MSKPISETMDLKNFIDDALSQILEGIDSSRKKVKNFGADINPKNNPFAVSGGGTNVLGLIGKKDSEDCELVYLIHFDVAVTITKTEKAEAKIGVIGGWFNLAAKGETGKSNEHVSRIQFSVPVKYSYS